METSDCAANLVCIEGVCNEANVPAPAISRLGLLLAMAVLMLIAGVSFARLTSRRR